MHLTFTVASVREVIARGIADAAENGGFNDPYADPPVFSDANRRPGFWLVGDRGVYIMSNGMLPDGHKPLVVYASECNPETSPDWWEVKAKTFGRDDGVEIISAEQFERLMAQNPAATILEFHFIGEALAMSAVAHERS